MSARRPPVLLAMIAMITTFIAGCASTQLTIVPTQLPPQQRLLDMRFAHVSIADEHVVTVLAELEREIARQSGGKLKFRYSYNSIIIPDLKISFTARDISLRELLDQIAREAHLTFDPDSPYDAYFDERRHPDSARANDI